MKLVKRETKQTKQTEVKKIVCTNWASQFRAEKDKMESPQQQWRKLFRS